MKIEIEKFIDEKRVIFSCQYGNGIAIWKCNSLQLKQYEVEMEIEDILRWGYSIKETNASVPSITINENYNIIVGILESIDEDGYSVVRIGNSILTFFVERNIIKTNSFVEIKAKKLLLTPYSY